jgi:putative CRISPR-associated protein (TIGR02620 family)
MSSNRVIVTRHAGLVQFLNEMGITGEVIGHATADNVRGKEVIGVLPLHLAALTESITSVDMELPPELRGVELSSEQVRKHFVRLTTYKVMTAAAINLLVHEEAQSAYTGMPAGRPVVIDLAKEIEAKA